LQVPPTEETAQQLLFSTTSPALQHAIPILSHGHSPYIRPTAGAHAVISPGEAGYSCSAADRVIGRHHV